MKLKIKKIILTAGLLLSMAALSACTSNKKADTNIEIDTEMETSLKQQSEQLISTIIMMSDEMAQQIREQDDAFATSAVDAWDGSKEELGEMQSIVSHEITSTNKVIRIKSDVAFEKHNADFVLELDKKFMPTTMTIDIKYSMAILIERAALNTVMGMGTVFLVLIFLSFLISLFKYIPRLLGVEQKKEELSEPVPVAAALPEPAEEEELADDLELTAVISAAIAASENTSADGFVVRSIKRVNNSKWQKAE